MKNKNGNNEEKKEDNNDDYKNENLQNISINNSLYKIEKIKDNILNDDINHKVIIVGDSSVGKTSLSIRITKDQYFQNQNATIGFDIFNYIAKINDLIIKLQIWDTCGLEEFSTCTSSLYKNSSLAIIVYAINNRDSFENVERWANLIKLNAKPETLIFVVGNKTDLEKERKVSKEEGEKLREKNLFNFFIETSAKNNSFVTELFNQAIIQLFEQYKEYQNIEKRDSNERIDFSRRKDSLALKKSNHNNSNNNNKKYCCF